MLLLANDGWTGNPSGLLFPFLAAVLLVIAGGILGGLKLFGAGDRQLQKTAGVLSVVSVLFLAWMFWPASLQKLTILSTDRGFQNHDEITIRAGVPVRFVAEGYYSDGETKHIKDGEVWNCSNGNATVTPGDQFYMGAYVTGQRAGPTVLRVTLEGKTAELPITISDAPLKTLNIDPGAINVKWYVGQGTTLNARGTFSDGTSHDLTRVCVWSSSDPNVALAPQAASDVSVFLSIVGPGKAVITAAYDGVEAKAHLVSTEPER